MQEKNVRQCQGGNDLRGCSGRPEQQPRHELTGKRLRSTTPDRGGQEEREGKKVDRSTTILNRQRDPDQIAHPDHERACCLEIGRF